MDNTPLLMASDCPSSSSRGAATCTQTKDNNVLTLGGGRVWLAIGLCLSGLSSWLPWLFSLDDCLPKSLETFKQESNTKQTHKPQTKENNACLTD